MNPRYDTLPEYMREPARLYVEEGQLPGGFLMAVLCNNLVEAARRADDTNCRVLLVWAQWLHWELPMDAWGSEEKVRAYAANRHGALVKAEAPHD